MNRNQFLIVTSLSGVVVVLLLLQIVLGKMATFDQVRLMQAQQAISQGQVCLNNLQKLALTIGQVIQKTQDPALKDLLARQQIQIGNPAAAQNTQNTPEDSNAAAPATQPAVTAPTTR